MPTKCLPVAHKAIVQIEIIPHSRSEAVCDRLTSVIDPARPRYSEYNCSKHSTAMATQGLILVIMIDRLLPTANIVVHGKRAAILCNRKV